MGENSAEEIMYCTKCGAVIKPEEKLCPNCGINLSEMIDESQPDVFVTFKILPNANAAEYMKNLLAASGIKSETRNSPTNENIEAVSVLVRISDLEKAKDIIENPDNEPEKMHLSDIFNSTFSIAGKTFKNNIILASLLIPAVIILIIGINIFLPSINFVSKNNKLFVLWSAAHDGETATNTSPINIIIFSSLVMIFIIAVVALYYGIIKTTGLVLAKKEHSISRIFKSIFSGSFLRALMSVVSMVAVVAGPYAASLLFIRIFSDNIFILIILSFLIFIPLIWFIYASVKYSFTFIHASVSGEGVLDSLKKSSFLVKKYWWRTLGIFLLFSLVINLITSLILTPIAFLMGWKILPRPEYLGNLGEVKMLLSTLAITTTLSIILKSLIEPIFITVMYYDLKNRKNDFYFIQEAPEVNEVKPDTSEPTEIV